MLEKRAATAQRNVLGTAVDRLGRAGLSGFLVPLVSSVLLALLIGPVFSGKEGGVPFVIGTFLYVLIVLGFLYVYLAYFHVKTVSRRRHLIAIHIPVLFIVAVAGLVQIDPWVSYFLVPYAFGAVLLTILFRPDIAAAVSIATVAILAHLYQFATDEIVSGPVFVATAGQFLGIFAVLRTRKRIQVVWAGLALAGLNIALAFLFLLTGFPGAERLGPVIICGTIAGLFAGPVAVGLLPLFENLLDVTTVFKIQELADLDHPVLRNLFLRAPGTYQHSMAVSNLAVTAAEAIGADWLLCRVGAYFHDIGKAEIPQYFAENEGYGGRSRHEDLKPSLSASVIRSHVTKGLKIAKEHGLPSAVCDFIPQHHGKSVIRFFYGKALEAQQAGPDSKAEYRHSGPKPQTRETAIVMLADSVEAVSRTLEKPSPSTVEETVRDIVRRRLLEGDLDESNLTLRDLDMIAESFIKVLNGIFHARPEYPSPDEIETAEKDAGNENRTAKGGVEGGNERERSRKPRKAATG